MPNRYLKIAALTVVGFVVALVAIVIIAFGIKHEQPEKAAINDYYYKDSSGIYINSTPGCVFICPTQYSLIKPAPYDDFKYIGPGYLAVDSKNVYCKEKLNDFDLESLKTFEGGIFKDNAHVLDAYCYKVVNRRYENVAQTDWTMHDMDAPSFEVSACSLLKDKNGVYYKASEDVALYIATGIDPQTFAVASNNGSNCEIKDKNHTYNVSVDENRLTTVSIKN